MANCLFERIPGHGRLTRDRKGESGTSGSRSILPPVGTEAGDARKLRPVAAAAAVVLLAALLAGPAAAARPWEPPSYADREGAPEKPSSSAKRKPVPPRPRPAARRSAQVPAVAVAVIDSGVDLSHPDLSGRAWTNSAEIPGNGVDDDGDSIVDDVHGADLLHQRGDPADTVGHGTHIAGVIGASPNPATGSGGVDPRARIMALKVDDGGWMDLGAAAAAIRYAADHGARVINLSWGNRLRSPDVEQAIAYAGDRGVLTVVAAGNLGVSNDLVPTYPASSPLDTVISVAATCDGHSLAAFSDYGKLSVDIAAAGCEIMSTAPGGGYIARTGTSMAAPKVAGVAALLFSEHPGATPLEIKKALLAGARPESALDQSVSCGGVLDVGGAKRALAAPDRTTPSSFELLAPAVHFTAVHTDLYYDRVTFSWSPSTDGSLAGYRLVLDGAPVAAVGTSSTSVTYPVAPGEHRWEVVAYDRSGNETVAG
jgi:subtilisin family serine protease